MTQIILDFSANTFKNDKEIIKRGVDEIKKIDTGKHEIVFKTQLFTKAGDNIPCTHESFEYLYEYGNSQGYKVTASVFDKESLDYLLKFLVPFIKIANRPDLYELEKYIPPIIKRYISVKDKDTWIKVEGYIGMPLICVSKYPASICDYVKHINSEQYNSAQTKFISDHTETWDIFNIYEPIIYECHYKLSDSTGLDAGSFARTPEQLKEIL